MIKVKLITVHTTLEQTPLRARSYMLNFDVSQTILTPPPIALLRDLHHEHSADAGALWPLLVRLHG